MLVLTRTLRHGATGGSAAALGVGAGRVVQTLALRRALNLAGAGLFAWLAVRLALVERA